VWTPAGCGDVALEEMIHCFKCGGLSETSDFYMYSVGFNAGCNHAKVRYGVNVPLYLIDRCALSFDVDHCRSIVR
jgi:hypothetical protein